MLFLVIVLLTVGSTSIATGTCLKGQFYDGEKCQKCSPSCPQNQIIKVICTEDSDVICKPFREFINFNQLDEIDKTGVKSVMEGITAIAKDEEAYWRNLAFALIGVLCAVFVVTTIVVLYACRKFRNTVSIKRRDEEDYDDQDSGYVVIRQIHRVSPPVETSRGTSKRHEKMPWLYRPKRRLLNEYVDDVFESEDSAGSRVTRKLTVIPERESEYNCDGEP